MKDLFEKKLQYAPPEKHAAIIDFCDTMDIAKTWFEREGCIYRADDLIRAAENILKLDQTE